MELEGWQRPERWPPLGDDQIQVWQVRLSEARGALEVFAAYLNRAERERAGRYIVEHARDQFIVARGCLRVLLGHALGIAPAAVELTLGEHGKPAPVGDTGVEFNVAHAKDVILIAMRRGGPVGIDVEWIDPAMETLEIAETTFTAREFDLICTASAGKDRLAAFYLCWTQKEAVSKADGRGLLLAPASFEVPIFDAVKPAAPSRVRVGASGGVCEQIYGVFALRIGEDYVGALAMQTPCGEVLSCRYPLSGPHFLR